MATATLTHTDLVPGVTYAIAYRRATSGTEGIVEAKWIGEVSFDGRMMFCLVGSEDEPTFNLLPEEITQVVPAGCTTGFRQGQVEPYGGLGSEKIKALVKGEMAVHRVGGLNPYMIYHTLSGYPVADRIRTLRRAKIIASMLVDLGFSGPADRDQWDDKVLRKFSRFVRHLNRD